MLGLCLERGVQGRKMKQTWSVTGAHCSAGERTLGDAVKIESLTGARGESREGSLRGLGGRGGRESWLVRCRECDPGMGAAGAKDWQGAGAAMSGPALLECNPGGEVCWEPGESGSQMTSCIYIFGFIL